MKDLEISRYLSPHAVRASVHLVARVRDEVRMRLEQVSLFGSSARREARPDSDVDLLLVFQDLPPDREPFATQAEAIAEEIASGTGVPLSVWSVSLPDLELGARTPMLVDALVDSIPLWCRREPLPAVDLTPVDAIRCAAALLDRVAEGSVEFERAMRRNRHSAAAHRLRDDLVRLCTGFLLLQGITRPRRASAIRAFLNLEGARCAGETYATLLWALGTYGESGTDDTTAPDPPAGGMPGAVAAVNQLRAELVRRVATLDERLPIYGFARSQGTRIAPRRCLDPTATWAVAMAGNPAPGQFATR